MALFRHITSTVWVLSLVSLFTDMASEMLYPVMPLYLKQIGFSVLLIGILEGLAEATAGLSKGYFGRQSDLSGKRVPFVQWGYALSAMSKPLLALWTHPAWVFGARTLDRLGKGIRTGARDALLSDEAADGTKGTVFGFHRAMDTLGAALGPALALVFLSIYPEHYRELFLVAFFPGLIAVFSSFRLHGKTKNLLPKKAKPSFFSSIGYWKESPAAYRKLCIGLLAFALFNSSDVFLLLRAKESGMDDRMLIGLYIAYNLVYALASYPLGMLADRIGLKNIMLFGILVFAGVYFGMAHFHDEYALATLFLLYGLYAAATDGNSKAWISILVAKEDTATALGSFAGFQSIAALLASSLAGLLWMVAGAEISLLTSAIAACAVAVYLRVFMK
ncbi:MAG: MFS transporter [Bacteroidetes bacterium]|nr:MFS transporter [Bacteroidota bacterium]